MGSFLHKLKNQVAGQGGISLVVVLWVLALLMIIATELVYTVRVDSMSAMNFKDEVAARELAKAGIEMGVAEIVEPYKLVYLNEEGRVSFVRQGENKNSGERKLELGDGWLEYAIEDESGKINLNTATRDTIAELLKNSGVEGATLEVVADSIMDWRDENHEHHLNGAEDSYYQNIPKAYESKDGFFDTVEELMLVRGMSPSILYGTEMARSEGASSDLTGHEYGGIKQYISVYGNGKININTASEGVLRAALGKGKAQEILLRRKTEGYYIIPSYGGTVSSEVFSIVSTGTVRGLSLSIRAIAVKKDRDVKIIYWNEEGYTGHD